MNAAEKNQTLLNAIHARVSDQFIRLHGPLNLEDARTLRLAQLTLHRWAELECGTGSANVTLSVERNEAGKPFMRRQWISAAYPNWQEEIYPVPDREAGALRRVAKVCKEAGLHFYHQTDPRGCALYVAAFPLNQSNYSQGIACL